MATVRNRVVFVGNIAFDVSEEQLISLFSEVGPVRSVRLVTDRDSGRPKGYGFIEYDSADIASSAVRNLNNRAIGNRNIRVDYSVDEATAEQAPPSMPPQQMPQQQMMSQQQFPQQPPQQMQQSAATDAITQLLASMNPNQMLDLMSQMKVIFSQ